MKRIHRLQLRGACYFSLALVLPGCGGRIADAQEATAGADDGQTNSSGGSTTRGGSATDGGTTSTARGSIVTALAVGTFHACAVVDGAVYCWGRNDDGQLGDGTTIESSVPVAVKGLSTGATAVACGVGHSCAVVGGRVQCWGARLPTELGIPGRANIVPVPIEGLPTGAIGLAAGIYHDCALINGGIWCWGKGLGEMDEGGSTAGSVPVAFPVDGLPAGVTAIAASDFYTCALVAASTECWGYNIWGTLGNWSGNAVPSPLEGLPKGATAIATGKYRACAVVNGGAYCWGNNDYGQLGNNGRADIEAPVQVLGLSSGVTAIAVSEYHICAVQDGKAQCWGSNQYGAVGNMSTFEDSVPLPMPVEGIMTEVTAIAAGCDFTCALAGGEVLCWGYNVNGQLGNRSKVTSPTPVRVLFP